MYAEEILAMSSSQVVALGIGIEYTLFFIQLYRKKSREEKSGLLGGHRKSVLSLISSYREKVSLIFLLKNLMYAALRHLVEKQIFSIPFLILKME